MRHILKLDAVFNHYMVLCRSKNIRIFGEAEDGAKIALTLTGQSAGIVAYQGRFEAVFAPI